MEENQLWFLIARHLSGEISADESKTLQELLKKHPDKHQLFDILQSSFVLPMMQKKQPVIRPWMTN
jgi:hypothetical protein